MTSPRSRPIEHRPMAISVLPSNDEKTQKTVAGLPKSAENGRGREKPKARFRGINHQEVTAGMEGVRPQLQDQVKADHLEAKAEG